MTDEERLDLLDHARRCAVLSEENARLRKRLDEVTMAYEATVDALRLLARERGVATDPSTRGRVLASDFSSATASVSICLPGR